MKAAITKKYGLPEVARIMEIEKPIPKENEILVKVLNTPVTSGDARIRGLNVPFGFKFLTRLMFGMKGPKNPVLGVVFSGIVEDVGEKVKDFSQGDAVFGSKEGLGCHAEYLVIKESGAIVHKPEKVSHEEAASIPFGALTSLKYLRDFGKIKKRQKILINGASGALGVYGVQLAKYFGAEVTGVCSTSNLELVKSLGADQVIDYKVNDFTKNPETYDIIYDTVGKLDFSKCKNSLNKNGIFLLAAAGLKEYGQVMTTSISGSKKVVAGVAIFKKEDLIIISELIEQDQIKPVIGRTFEFSDIIEAYKYVDGGHKVASAVLKV
ncbi:NAD(P)-dependent alcohol dehydrogenase [Lutimonas zeaxanthinifaciens]|uniref:NAD(P)-dependent alcohol dehydrogenase n=1 Tax=Lutimonas zeaxanthinifaciens TaxID=3060215 RepID=UPI00265CAFBD|nr:NAD(P)-dependent alcohol dehydrogenase [Lutimonas sp. YSD2104]WKK64586.1 NAD(P)-dependent alcohol dehydrogenase [Lutimonas sp. YSD2104]